MPGSSATASRPFLSASAILPGLLLAVLLAIAPQAAAITSIRGSSTLIAQVDLAFRYAFIPVNGHLPKYPIAWALNPADCLAGSDITLDANTGRLSGTPFEPGTYQCCQREAPIGLQVPQ